MTTSAQVDETSVTTTDNSPSQDYTHPDDQTTLLTSIACTYTWVCMAKTFFYVASTAAIRLNLNLFYIQLSYRYDIPKNYFHFVLTFYSLSLSFPVDDHPVLKADSIKYIIIFRNMVSRLKISYRMFFSLLSGGKSYSLY